MKYFLYISFFLFSFLFSKPFHTIKIDGDLSDFSADESLILNPIEELNDSLWLSPEIGSNELKNIYLTWDMDNIYIGIAGKVTNNGLLVFIDTTTTTQQNTYMNLTEIKTWNRSLWFKNYTPTFFYGSWNQNPGWFYRITSRYTASDISGYVKTAADRFSNKPGFELSIPFEILFNLGKGKTVPYAKISIFATLVTSDLKSKTLPDGTTVHYGYIGGDIIPNQNIPLLTETTVYLFLSKEIDKNGDLLPDDYYAGTKLEILNFNISDRIFTPEFKHTKISFNITKPANVDMFIFNSSGEIVRKCFDGVFFSDSISYSWDGRDGAGNYVSAGVYIFNLRVSTPTEKKIMNKAVAVIR